MIKKILLYILLIIASLFICFIVVSNGIILPIIMILFDDNTCVLENLENVKSPNNEYKIITYKENCHATVDYTVKAKLCTNDNECKDIYTCYQEKDSYVYWIDNETVSINNKILNIKKDIYNWKKDDNYYENRYIKES